MINVASIQRIFFSVKLKYVTKEIFNQTQHFKSKKNQPRASNIEKNK